MIPPPAFRRIAHALLVLLSLATTALPAAALAGVRLSADGKSFVLAVSGQPFRVWGVNDDHDSHGEHGRLIEDYWEDEWETVRRDFREMKQPGSAAK